MDRVGIYEKRLDRYLTDSPFTEIGQSVDKIFETSQIGQGLDKIRSVKSLSRFLTAVSQARMIND